MALKFSTDTLDERLGGHHPDLLDLLGELTAFAETLQADVIITCLDRSEKENEAVGGSPLSWHLFKCAVDLRVTHWTHEQRKQIARWLVQRCKRPDWELVLSDHGTGPHFHVARRDAKWRNRSK